jgi:CRP/FNR family cyclic AMP-dependent transcriptional regulator
MADGAQPWLKREFYAPGMTLMEQGGRSGRLFVLKEGEVEVERDGAFITSVRQPGSIFGEMSLLLERPHSASVRAVSAVEVLVIDNAIAVLEAHPTWTLQIARLLAERVNATTAMLTAKSAEEREERLVLPHYVMSQWSDPQV